MKYNVGILTLGFCESNVQKVWYVWH